jgi:hypothetical protein
MGASPAKHGLFFSRRLPGNKPELNPDRINQAYVSEDEKGSPGVTEPKTALRGLYAQTLENSVKLDFGLPQSGAALALAC